MNFSLIVSPDTVLPLLNDPNVLIIDLSPAEEYKKAHLPGAQNMLYSDFVVTGGDHDGAIVDDEKIIALFSAKGIDREKTIFVYDCKKNAQACRLIWTLHVFDHYNVSLIDGGLAYWQHLGYPLTDEVVPAQPTDYYMQYGRVAYADKNFVLEQLQNPVSTLLDTRGKDEFYGQKVLKNTKRGGHISGAKNIDWVEFFDDKNFNRVKPKEEIAELLKAKYIAPEREIVVYCHSHLRSSHTYVVLKAMGYDKVVGYAGSWKEWSASTHMPLVISDEPYRWDEGKGSDPANRQFPLLIEAEELQPKLGNKNLIIVDVSLENIYQQGHIPGSRGLGYPNIMRQHDDCDGDIPDNKMLSLAFSLIGMDPECHIVAYDRQGGPMAARLLWTLEEIGHTNYSYLNGGLAAWKAAGFEVTTKTPAYHTTNYLAQKTGKALAEKDNVLCRLGNPNTVILDVRLEEEFNNETLITDRGGHIPGAKLFNWEETVMPDQYGKIIDPEALQEKFNAIGATKDKEIIVYCQTHTRSAHTFFLLKLLGYENIKGYCASYSEWGNNPDVPIENGCKDCLD